MLDGRAPLPDDPAGGEGGEIKRFSEEPDAPDEPAAPKATWFLAGTATGLDPDAKDPVEVQVDWEGTDTRSIGGIVSCGSFIATAEFRVPMLDAPPGSQTTLRVRVEDPRYMPVERRVSVALFELQKGGHAVGQVQLVLQRAGVLSGRVVNERGEPVIGAAVALAVPASEEIAPALVGRMAQTDAQGRYLLRAAADGEYRLLVVQGIHSELVGEHLQPHMESVLIRVGEEREGPTVRLKPAVSIRGRVLQDGEPLAGAEVEARPAFESELAPFKVGTSWVGRREGVLYRELVTATSDKEGRFEIHGLSPVSWVVGLSSLDDDTLLHSAAFEGTEREWTAPAENVKLHVVISWFDVRVTRGGKAVPDAQVALACMWPKKDGSGDSYPAVTRITGVDDAGRVRRGVSPGAAYGLWEFTGGAPGEIKRVTAPPAGETQIVALEVEPHKVKPTLVLQLEGPGAKDIGFASVFVVDADPGISMPMGTLFMSPEMVSDGVARFFSVDPKRFLFVVPGGDPLAGELWVPVVKEVRWPARGEHVVRVTVRKGAGLGLNMRTPEGASARVDLELLDATGGNVRRQWISIVDEKEGRIHLSQSGCEGRAVVYPALPPGDYTLRITAKDKPPVEKDLKLVKGKVTELTHTVGE